MVLGNLEQAISEGFWSLSGSTCSCCGVRNEAGCCRPPPRIIVLAAVWEGRSPLPDHTSRRADPGTQRTPRSGYSELIGGVQTGFSANRARACVIRAILVIFVLFRSGGANPLFSWTEWTFVIFAIFVKTPCFRQGAKTPFDKKPRLRLPELSFSSVEICRKTLPAKNFGQPQASRAFWTAPLEALSRTLSEGFNVSHPCSWPAWLSICG